MDDLVREEDGSEDAWGRLCAEEQRMLLSRLQSMDDLGEELLGDYVFNFIYEYILGKKETDT